MQPKKVKYLLPGIAQQLNLHTDLVEAVNNFFWDHTRKALSEAPKLTVHIPNLGDFAIKHWKLETELATARKSLATVSSKPKPNQHVQAQLSLKVEQLERLRDIQTAENQRREFIKNFKKTKQEDVTANITASLEE